jgi:hypothetical protein
VTQAPVTAVPGREDVLRRPPSRRAITRALLLVAAGIGVATGLVLVDRMFDPAHTATGYFGALADRDAGAALDRLDPDAGPAGALMNSDVLRSSAYTPPSAVRVGAVRLSDHGNSASVKVTFTAGGSSATADLPLIRSGHSFLLFQRWRIQSGAFPVTVVAPAIDEVDVAGVRVAAGAPVAAFPGAYLAGVPDNPLLTAAPAPVVAVPDAPPLVLQPTIRSGAGTAVGKQVRSFLDTCTLSTSIDPPGCPLSDTTYNDVTDVRWKIISYPQSTLQITGNQVLLTTTGPGQAQWTGEQQDFGESVPAGNTVSFEVAGEVQVRDGKVQWQPAS